MRWRCLALILIVVGVPAGRLWSAAPMASAERTTLRTAAGDGLLIGCAASTADVANPALAALIAREFNALTADHEMMPSLLVDEAGRYTFERGDRVAQFAAEHRMPCFGHMLLWHHLTRDWLFQDEAGRPLPRERALANLRGYIETVMGHYRGRVKAWDVVNEAISDAEGEYLRDTPARRAIGDDYIERAFALAQAADPAAELYYNDYNIELPEKRVKALRLIRSLRDRGVRIDAIGIQGHWMINFPAVDVIREAIREFQAAGVKVMITELDVDVLPRTVSGANLQTVEHGPNPYPDGLPADVQAALARRYGEIFAAVLQPPGVTMITFWGTHDGGSWLNDFPVKRRTNHPLLFDRALQPKPAFTAVVEALERARRK